jgi:hypothetical protein
MKEHLIMLLTPTKTGANVHSILLESNGSDRSTTKEEGKQHGPGYSYH